MIEYDLMVVGSLGVGKSALTKRLVNRSSSAFMEAYEPTHDDLSYRRQVQVDSVTCVLDVLDTTFREDEFSAMRHQYTRTAKGFLYVYSITSRESFDELSAFREEIRRVRANFNPDDNDDVPAVLVGNKCDLESERVVTTAEGADLAKAFGRSCQHVETSAKAGINVEHCFFTLVREINNMKATAQADNEKRMGCTKKSTTNCTLS